jgi:predicted DNA-binding transcriptional regulator YafY
VAGLGEPAMRTLGKLDQVLPARLRASVEAVSEATVTLGRRSQLVEGAVVALLARATRGCHEVRFDYAAASGEKTSRRAEPYRLVATTSHWYLLAWDRDRADWRSFRLDRMSAVRETTFAFRPRDAPDAAEHVREALTRGSQGIDVVIDIDAPLDVVAEALPAGVGTVSALGDRCEMRFAAWDVRAAAARLAWLPWQFRVVTPHDLTDELAALADRLGQASRRR